MVKKSAVVSLIVALIIISAMAVICLMRGTMCSEDRYNRSKLRGERIRSERRVAERLVSSQYSVPFHAKSETNPEFEPLVCVGSLKKQPSAAISREDAMQIASDKNQVMDALLGQSQIPADYGETMIALFRDPAQDVVTRDFAVQHIGLYAQALNRRGQYNADSADVANCRKAMFDAAEETGTIVAAAAFRALADISEFDSRIDARRLDNMLIRCAIDESASLAVRVMAVQLCGERKVTSSESAIKTILDGKSAPEPLRRAASHSLKLLRGNVP